MRRLMLLMIVAMMSSASFSQSVMQGVRQNETDNIHVLLANAKVSKDAKKRAKADVKDGWKIMGGEKSLERQYAEIDVYASVFTTNQYGTQIPRYLSHTGSATGKTYNMAPEYRRFLLCSLPKHNNYRTLLGY